jgi:hypothetical protein
MSSTNAINFAGQVSISGIVIKTMSGKSVDITNMVVGIQYYESIWSPYTTGYLIISDSLAMASVLPLQGTEIVHIRVSVPSMNSINDLSGVFYLYNMSAVELTTDKNQTYKLGFCSREMIVSSSKGISQAFSGVISDIATVLITNENYLAAEIPVAIDPTKNAIKYISNYWSVVKNMQYLCDRAISRYSNSPNYVFFANRAGLNFISLSTLYTNSVYQTFYLDKWTKDISTNSVDINAQYQRATEFSVEGDSYNYVDSLTNGTLTSTAFSYDIFRKTFLTNRFSYIDDFSKSAHLNNTPMFGGVGIEPVDSKIYNYPRDFSNFSGFGDSSGENVFQQRHSMLRQLKSNIVKVTVPMRTDYTVGQLYNLVKHTNAPTSKSNTSNIDNTISGKYIATTMQHFVTPSSGQSIIELSRDC